MDWTLELASLTLSGVLLDWTLALAPPRDYGSMVNEIVGTCDWDNADLLGET